MELFDKNKEKLSSTVCVTYLKRKGNPNNFTLQWTVITYNFNFIFL